MPSSLTELAISSSNDTSPHRRLPNYRRKLRTAQGPHPSLISHIISFRFDYHNTLLEPPTKPSLTPDTKKIQAAPEDAARIYIHSYASNYGSNFDATIQYAPYLNINNIDITPNALVATESAKA